VMVNFVHGWRQVPAVRRRGEEAAAGRTLTH
jgi:hypothetical protein